MSVSAIAKLHLMLSTHAWESQSSFQLPLNVGVQEMNRWSEGKSVVCEQLQTHLVGLCLH